MPAPYSDNLYSAPYDASEDEAQHQEEEDAMSPTDGYFHASRTQGFDPVASSSSSSHHQPTASNVPIVPNILVEDPSLARDQSDAKQREAEEERRLNTTEATLETTSPPLASRAQPIPPRSPHSSPQRFTAPHQSRSSHSHSHLHSHSYSHRRSIDEIPDSDIHPTAGTSAAAQQYILPSAAEADSYFRRQHQRDAPPAYSPTSTPSAHDQASRQLGYQTLGPTIHTTPVMGIPDEHQRLLPRQPESMGGNHNGPPPTVWQKLKATCSISNSRGKLKTMLGVLVICSILAVILGVGQSHFSRTPSMPDFSHENPVRPPSSESPPDFTWTPQISCYNDPFKFPSMVQKFSTSASHGFKLIQTISRDEDSHTGWQPHVSGSIILRRSSDSSSPRLEVDVISNDRDVGVDLDIQESGVYKLVSPRKVAWARSSYGPCIQIRATLWLPNAAKLRAFEIDAVHLDIVLTDGLSFATQDGVQISTVVGDVTAPKSGSGEPYISPYQMLSRETRIRTVSGDIRGEYFLYDLLKIESVSGDIKVDIEPKTADGKNPRSATLQIETASGGIQAHEPLSQALSLGKPEIVIPARDYVSKISTYSGDLDIALAVSSSTIVSTKSGKIQLELLPILNAKLLESSSSQKPSLKTETFSGDTKVVLHDPIWTSIAGSDVHEKEPRWKFTWPPSGDAEDWVPFDERDPYVIIHPHDIDKNINMAPSPSADYINEKRGFSHIGEKHALSILQSKHTSISGDINLIYSNQWEGSLRAQTMSGTLKIHGDGLETSRLGRFPTVIEGHKGDGHSSLIVETTSGDQYIMIGHKA